MEFARYTLSHKKNLQGLEPKLLMLIHTRLKVIWLEDFRSFPTFDKIIVTHFEVIFGIINVEEKQASTTERMTNTTMRTRARDRAQLWLRMQPCKHFGENRD